MNAAHFRDVASLDHPPGRQAVVDNTAEGKIQKQILELTARIDSLMGARQDGQGREKWNKDDDGPTLSDEALVGRGGPLDRRN